VDVVGALQGENADDEGWFAGLQDVPPSPHGKS
jgi:hypothetical protein